eukprot:Protomagalhaensia_wolfi_Nauph_80__1435@NODE_1863_length_1299_cov_920_239683_g1454_i0_p1_GENE_NODE_1863_length_1299_cov_920_239683_g1454_i0NODE_1863_length_1299_cov_920_239683_g1454_i0_p1_ORF_typecomplete_len167_score32_63Clat_adaptor_s/PF01217_20/1_9e53AP5_subunit_s1/PF15001_6/0_049_NODE_1863_length_1299_cov_920_239683_g1454_i0241741
MIQFVLLVSRQGKTRLEKFYNEVPLQKRASLIKDIAQTVITRPLGAAHVLRGPNYHLVYKRYASLYFIVGVDDQENELGVLEFIHHFVEILDRYFGNVCELDLIFNFHKVHMILDEIVQDGMVQETSKKTVLRLIAAQDVIIEDASQNNSGLLAAADLNRRAVRSL